MGQLVPLYRTADSTEVLDWLVDAIEPIWESTAGAYHLLAIVHSLYKSSSQLFYLSQPYDTTEATTV